MNMKLTGVGAEPKKLAILGILLAIFAYFYFSNSTPSEQTSSQPHSAVVPPRDMSLRPIARASRAAQIRNMRNAGDFKPSLRIKDKDFDRSRIDPTLRLDLLAKLKDVKVEGGARSLFEFGQAAPVVALVKEPPKIFPFIGPHEKPKIDPVQAAAAAAAAAPPIPLKFYGFVNQVKPGEIKRAFFLDGDDIFVAAEGEMVKNRYKIVRIGINSAIVEDTQYKHHQQTLPLVQEITG